MEKLHEPTDFVATTFALDGLTLDEIDRRLAELGVPEAARQQIVAEERQRRVAEADADHPEEGS